MNNGWWMKSTAPRTWEAVLVELANRVMCGMFLVAPGEKKIGEILLYVEMLDFFISSAQ